MKNILELKEERLNLQNELTSLVGQAETRALEDTENSRLAEIKASIDQIDEDIRSIELENQKIERNNKTNKQSKTMENKEIRLYELIKGVVDGNLTDEQRQYVQGNKIDFRSVINVTNATEGQENVPEEKKSLETAIRNATVLNKLGVTWFNNAVGDISLPHYNGSSVAWKGENVAAADGAGAFSEIVLKPKRLTGYIDVSKTFLKQDSNDAEAILIDDIAKAIAEKLDQTVFGAASGTTDMPEGLFYNSGYTVTGETQLSAVTYDDVLALEDKVEEKNGTDFIFVAHPKVKYAFKSTDRASGFGKMVLEGRELDGYPIITSNSVVNKGLMCVCPQDIAVATWGGIEITVDTVSRAIYNEVRIVINYQVDCKLRENKRIACEIFD